MYNTIKDRFHKIIPNVDFCSLRYVEEQSEILSVRQNIVQAPSSSHDSGVMLTIMDKGGLGYAATSDLSEQGLRNAIKLAQQWAELSRNKSLIHFSQMSHEQGEYYSTVAKSWNSVSTADKLDLLLEESRQCHQNDKIVDSQAYLYSIMTKQLYLTNAGGEIIHEQEYLIPSLQVTANHGIDTQYRSFSESGRQGGLEILDHIGFVGKGKQLSDEALQLLAAPNCPTDNMDLVLAPDQMMLQIHESIGHPLELDRILGDERNYAGTSFVDLDMFGNYQYGSPLLNVSYDPTIAEEIASYDFDDEGSAANKVTIIDKGILVNPLGGENVANSRACSWNRPAIDRMANLNVEAGNSSFNDIISSVERGIFMQTNLSWSIDDSRNKFQFGCERAQLIENGELTQIVKNPNYRGISANFWRNLKMVGNADTFKVMGVANCGKGEPNQVIRVGHASPVCLFSNIDVFGGAV